MKAPRRYPKLAGLAFSWLKRGRYWIVYDPAGPIIAGVFFETDDIPDRPGRRSSANIQTGTEHFNGTQRDCELRSGNWPNAVDR